MKKLSYLILTTIFLSSLQANDITKNLSNLINSEGNLIDVSNGGLPSYSSNPTNALVVIRVGGNASNDGYLGSSISTDGTSVSWDFDTDGYNKGDLRIVNQSDEPLNLRKIKIEGSWSGASDSPHMRLVYLDSDIVVESDVVVGTISDLTKGIIPSSSEAVTHFQSFYNNALKVRVTSAGTTSLTQGDIVTLDQFNNANVGASTPAESTAVTFVKVVSKGDTSLTEGSYVTTTFFNSSNNNLIAGSANAAEATNDGTTYAYVPLDSTFSETILIGEIISTKAWIPAGGSASFRILFNSPDSNTYSFNLSNVEFEGFLYSQFPSAVADDAASYVAGVGNIGIYDFYQNEYTPTNFVTTGENKTKVEDMAIKIENGDLELVLGKHVSGTDTIGGGTYQIKGSTFGAPGQTSVNREFSLTDNPIHLALGAAVTEWGAYDAFGTTNIIQNAGNTSSIKFGNVPNQQRMNFRITNTGSGDLNITNITYDVRNAYNANHPDQLQLATIDSGMQIVDVLGIHTFGGATRNNSNILVFNEISNSVSLTVPEGEHIDLQLKYLE